MYPFPKGPGWVVPAVSCRTLSYEELRPLPPLRCPSPLHPGLSLVLSEQNVIVLIVTTESVGKKRHKHLVRNFLPFD